MALFEIGSERPGLILKQSAKEHLNSKACFWVEVSDASGVAKEVKGAGIHELGPLLETATGFTVEVTDLWGNVVGFADYRKRPDMARSFE